MVNPYVRSLKTRISLMRSTFLSTFDFFLDAAYTSFIFAFP